MNETHEKATREQILSFMTTEHFTLATARSATVAESNGRVQLYIGAVSSAVVALAFIGQVSGITEAFFVFGLVLFPSLLFLGIVTFDRVLQTALEEWIYCCEINRIRHYYTEIAPEMKRYFIESTHDDAPGALQAIGIKPDTWQYFLTGSGMVGVINSILIGVFTGLICKFGFAAHLYVCAAIGIVFFSLSVFLHYRRQISCFTKVGTRLKMLFPREPENKSKELK